MEISIKGDSKEIAALMLEVQSHQNRIDIAKISEELILQRNDLQESFIKGFN